MVIIKSQVVNNFTLYTAEKINSNPGVAYNITKKEVNGMVLNTLEKRKVQS